MPAFALPTSLTIELCTLRHLKKSAPRKKLQLLWLACASLLLVAIFISLANPFIQTNRLDNLRYLGVSAARMMERHLQFYEDYDNTTLLERAVHEFLFGSKPQIEQEVMTTYREVLNHFGADTDDTSHWTSMNIKSRLIITIAEKRDLAELKEALSLLSNDPEEEVLANTIRYAYLDDTTLPFTTEIYAGLTMVPQGWAADRLRYRVAIKTGNDRLAAIIEQRLMDRGRQHRLFVIAMVLTVASMISIGLYLMIRYRILHTASPWNKGVLSNPWPIMDGLTVAVTSALIGLIIVLALQLLLNNPFFTPHFFTLWSTLFASLPMLWFIHRYLLIPRGLNFRSAFGLRIPEAGLRHFFTISAALLTLEWVGLLLIGWGTWKLGLGSHWSEGMQERLVFGPTQTVVLSTISMVIWAPIFEEIGFRGLLYSSLRSKLAPTTAIVISALLFSAMHLYSVAGFLSVFWSGLILAYAYERYHSLLPGMVIHAAGNLLSISPLLLFYR